MKATILVIFVIVSLAAAEYYPGRDGICDFKCADVDVPICGYDGTCYHTFQSQCFFDNYNCRNGKLKFRKINEGKCDPKLYWRCSPYYQKLNDLILATYSKN